MSSLTKDELYSIFKQCKPTFNKPPDLDEAVKLICEKLGLSEDMTLKIYRNYYGVLTSLGKSKLMHHRILEMLIWICLKLFC